MIIKTKRDAHEKTHKKKVNVETPKLKENGCIQTKTTKQKKKRKQNRNLEKKRPVKVINKQKLKPAHKLKKKHRNQIGKQMKNIRKKT